eukprot:7553275-Pyramimonas_sp.AAC.1
MTGMKGSLPSPRLTKPQSGLLCSTSASCATPKGRTYGAFAVPPDLAWAVKHRAPGGKFGAYLSPREPHLVAIGS